jgi:deoxyribodipyrimidine photo-lyase
LNKIAVNIVWFKRDLRFTDHEPLFYASQQNIPIVLIYFFEPSVMNYDDSDVRHWRFIYESIQDLQRKLNPLDSKFFFFHQEVQPVFEELLEQFDVKSVFSHQEIGNKITYNRDVEMQAFFKKNKVEWKEFQMHGVIRKLKSRKDWDKRWENVMRDDAKIIDVKMLNIAHLDPDFYEKLKGPPLHPEITTPNKNFQQGGENLAWRYLDSFVKERYVNYSKHISKPALSRKGCSRLSPYLAYGNISMRAIYQYTNEHYEVSKNKRAILNFVSRLHWHCHFMQKFEDECEMEFENANRFSNSRRLHAMLGRNRIY